MQRRLGKYDRIGLLACLLVCLLANNIFRESRRYLGIGGSPLVDLVSPRSGKMGSKKATSKFQLSRALENMLLELAGYEVAGTGDSHKNLKDHPDIKNSESDMTKKSNTSITTEVNGHSSAHMSPAAHAGGKRLRSSSSNSDVGRRHVTDKRRKPSPDEESLRRAARRLKHEADVREEPDKYEVYLGSCLKFMELCHLYILSKPVEDQVFLLCTTAELLEFTAGRCSSKCRKALSKRDKEGVRQYARLAVLASRLSAIVRMARFSVKAEKLNRIWTSIDHTKSKLEKADKLRRSGLPVSAHQSSDFYVSSEAQVQHQQHCEFVLKEARDSALGMHFWFEAEALATRIEHEMPDIYAETVESLPEMDLLGGSLNLTDAVVTAQPALRLPE